MSPQTPVKKEKSVDELKAQVEIFSRLGIWSGCVVFAALFFGAVARIKHCATAETVAEFAVAVGVLGEVLFHHLASKASDELLRRSEARVRELERLNEPRRLSLEQINRIAEKLTHFPGTVFVAGVNSPTQEQMNFAQSLEDALAKAKWRQIDCPSPLGMEPLGKRQGRRYLCKGADTTNVRIGAVSVPPRLSEIPSTLEVA